MAANRFATFTCRGIVTFFVLFFFSFCALGKFVEELVPVSRYVDELLLIMGVGLLIAHLIRGKLLYVEAWVMVLLMWQALLIGVSPYSELTSGLVQSVINVKAFIFFAILLHLRPSVNTVWRVLWFIFIVSILGAVLQIIQPEWFEEYAKSRYRIMNDIPRLYGFQLNPSALSYALGIPLLIFAIERSRNAPVIVSVYLLFTVIFFLTASRTFLLLPASLLLYLSLERGFRKRSAGRWLADGFALAGIAGFAVAISIGVWGSWVVELTSRNLQSGIGPVEESGYIRGIMLYEGARVAGEMWPFSAGPGTFGTVLSQGSPLYEFTGLADTRWYAGWHGLFDTAIGSYLAEIGYLGLLVLILAAIQVSASGGRSAEGRRLAKIRGLCLLPVIVGLLLSSPAFASGLIGSLLALMWYVFAREHQG